MKLTPKKLEGWGYRSLWWKFRNPNFDRFSMIHPSYGQTDGRVGRAISYMCYSIYAVQRKKVRGLQTSSCLVYKLQILTKGCADAAE